MDSEGIGVQGLRGQLVLAGCGTPLSRAFVAAVVAGTLAYALKMPTQCFDEETGKIRPLAYVSKDPTATKQHFLAVPVAAGVAAYLFT
jgi:hypothetical protein